MNSIFTRRSVRQFQEKEVEPQKIERLLKAAMQAPSAVNQQPWEFVIVDDKEILTKLADFSMGAKTLLNAPLAIIILERQDIRFPMFAAQDLGACMENLLLQAVEDELGAVCMGILRDSESEEYIINTIHLPAGLRPFCVLAVGHPQNAEANIFVGRFDEARIHYNRF